MKWNKTTTLFILLTTTVFSAERRVIHYYQKNKKIWGTYSLKSERTKVRNKKDRWKNEVLGDIVLKKKRIHFVTPVRKEGRTLIKVHRIPYKKISDKYHLSNMENLSFKETPTDAYCQRIKGKFACTFNFKE